LTVTPDGTRVYVALSFADRVAVIDTSSHGVIATIQVGSLPHGIAASPDGTRVYVTHNFNNSVSVIDTATPSVIATIPLGAPFAIAVNTDGTRAYVGTAAGTIAIIDTATNTIIDTIEGVRSPTPWRSCRGRFAFRPARTTARTEAGRRSARPPGRSAIRVSA
jgi:YVTN family beta-propeller protein